MQKFDTINVIPFVDIMLVLLAIVLTTATFVRNGELQIALPQARASAGDPPLEAIEIAVDENALLYVDGKKTELNELETKLQSLDKAALVSLKIDKSAEFHQFVTIVDMLKAQSFENLSIGTRKTL